MSGEDRARLTDEDRDTHEADRAGGSSRERLRRDIRATLMPGFSGFEMPGWLHEAFTSGLLSVCVYGENVRDEGQLRELGAALRLACPEALIAIDEEGGEVTRLHYRSGSPYPGAAVLGRIDDTGYTRRIGERVGRDILATGFDLALGPVADVNSDPRNPVIGTRSFAADPALAARHVAAWVEGLQCTGAVACAKHFPGHGDTSQDSHLELPTVDVPLNVLEERELVPFRAAVEAGVGAVMTSHILLPQIDPSGPATFSRLVLQRLLREELGFDGLIVSDALDMRGASGAAGTSGAIGIPEAAVRALIAGCDLLCLGTSTGPTLLAEIEAAVITAIDEGRLDEDRVADAASRVRGLANRNRPFLEVSDRPLLDALEMSPARDELDRISQSFASVDTARAWFAAHPRAGVIRVESEPNQAVGRAPWGPFAAGLTAEYEAHDETAGVWAAAHPDGAIVIGRGLHLLPFARAGIDALRASGTPVLTIELGWPNADTGTGASTSSDGTSPAYADLACYGSTRLVGAALLHLIDTSGAPE